MIEKWQRQLAEGHTETWLATFIVLWAIAVSIVAIYLSQKQHPAIKWILAGIILYEVLP